MQLTERHNEYWRKNLVITAILLFVWFVVTFVEAWYARELNSITFFGWPLALLVLGAGLARDLRDHHRRLRLPDGQARQGIQRATRGTWNEHRFVLALGVQPPAQEVLRPLHRRLHRLHHRARDRRAARHVAAVDRLLVPVRHHRPVRRHRHHEPHRGSRRVLRRGTPRAGVLQRHGDRRRLDERGLLHRHGRHAVPDRLRRPRLGDGLDRRLLPGGAVPRALPAQVRPVHHSRLPRRALRRQHRAHHRHHLGDHLLVRLRRRADLRRRPDHQPVHGPGVRRRRVRRPGRHPGVLDAGRDARGDLDPGGAVHHPDHRLPDAGGLARHQAHRRTGAAARLRLHAAKGHRAGEEDHQRSEGAGSAQDLRRSCGSRQGSARRSRQGVRRRQGEGREAARRRQGFGQCRQELRRRRRRSQPIRRASLRRGSVWTARGRHGGAHRRPASPRRGVRRQGRGGAQHGAAGTSSASCSA